MYGRLYRGKSREDGKWVYGVFLPLEELILEERRIGGAAVYYPIPVAPETVGQDTGWFTMSDLASGDTECTFIYEGDIVEAKLKEGNWSGFSWGRHEVLFEKGAFCLRDSKGRTNPICNYSQNVEFEVLGNIYDNPELLEGKR